MCSQSKLAFLHGLIPLNHVAIITLFYQGDSELLFNIPFAKTNGIQLAMLVCEFTLLLSTIFLCKNMKVTWLCKRKGFHNSFLRVLVRVKIYWHQYTLVRKIYDGMRKVHAVFA